DAIILNERVRISMVTVAIAAKCAPAANHGMPPDGQLRDTTYAVAANINTNEAIVTNHRVRPMCYSPRGLVRRVGCAESGSSGHGCLGYRPRISFRTSK